MLGGITTKLVVTVILLFVTLSRAEIDFSLVTLPDWRANTEYVTQCSYDGHDNLNCDWTQRRTVDGVVTTLESGPLGLEGKTCLEFWYLSPVVANGSELRALLKSNAGLRGIWTLPALPRDRWRQAFVPMDTIEPGTQVVLEAESMEGQFALNRIGVRRGSCGPQCEPNTELWTDESTRCLCSGGQLSCSPSQCPKGQICAPQIGRSSGISASGMCTIHSHTDCSTFDGEVFRFMAPCTYMLAKTCSTSKTLPVFSVEVVNEPNWNSSLNTVQQVTVDVGDRVSLLKRQTHRVVVNGVWRKLPLSLGNGTVYIKSNPAAVELRTTFGLSVSYDNAGAVHVALPSTYSDEVCGLCGNFNHLRGDDFRKPDGTNAQDATDLAESWQTGPTTSSCETILVPHQCDPQELAEYTSELYCGGLLSPSGFFANCLSVLGVESYFRGCVVAMCSTHGDPAALCETFQVYADTCQVAGVSIPTWRNSTFCPLQCGENSHYNSCADGCPEVCSSLDAVGSCGSCEERCECDAGLKLSGGKCVPAEDCGCWYNGKHYEIGATFSEGECEQRCQCMGNDEVRCIAMQCTDDEVCKVKGGVKDCFPFKPATCSVYGDPHYITFDGMAYDFQGGCSYMLTTTCGGESSIQFAVTGHNMHPPQQNFTRSKLEAVALLVEDLHVMLNQSGEVHVNNRHVQLPYSTNGTFGSVWVYLRSNYIVLETSFGLRMTIDAQNRLFLQVDERYKYELCGLCGTYSERQDDDFITPGEQNATGPFEFGDSWRVPGDNECISHPNDPRLCDYEEENEAYNECDALLGDAFNPCHELIHPSIYLTSCVDDYCATGGDQHTLCESLKSYAAACQVAGMELPNWQTDTACADPPTTPTPPPATSPTPDQTLCPINCDFDKNMCGWEQLIQDSFDWTRNSGPTPTTLTGPNQDHTTGAGYYMYIEGNSVTHGDSARLLSSACHYNGPLCLRFWYHMYGSATAMALNIYLLKDNKSTKVWAKMNNQGPEWHLGNVEITVSGPFRIIVEAIRGSNAQSDVAIDDISIHFGSCSGSLPAKVGGTKPPSRTAEVLPSLPVCNMECSFNSNLCSWTQMMSDAFDWTWQSGSTPTMMTGPSADHSGGGHYLYIEASSVTHGDTARLISNECSDSGPHCLHFWYHMYGSADTMGLHVYLLQDRLADAVWWKRNNQGNVWHLAQVDITTTGPYQIIIEGRRGSNEESDVAIDDVRLYRGQCSNQSGEVGTAPPSVPVPTTAAPQPPLFNVTAVAPTEEAPLSPVCQLNCNFEQDLCQWNQLLADVFDWTRNSGSTPTMMTGPSSDHTTGGGHYLYIEGNSATHGDTARLVSSECSDTGPQCLQFWYHMYGSADTMGLHVYLFQDRKANAVWRKRNDQGNIWHLAQVDLTTTGPFLIIFEGRRGSNDESDVAIDDVSFHRGHCTDIPATTVPTTFNSVATAGPEFPPVNSSTATQPQTRTTPIPGPAGTTTFTIATHSGAPTTQLPRTSVQPEPEVTEKPQTTEAPEQTTASTGIQSTPRPYPPSTEHPGIVTSAHPEPEVTVGPQTTESTGETASSTGPKTTARPQPPSTEHPGVETSAQPEPEGTEGPKTTDKQATTGPKTTARPHPPSTEHPGEVETSAQPQPEVTERPQTTLATEMSAQPEPEVTERPQTTAEEATTSTGPKTTTRPYPASTEHPGGVETSAQPEPEVTEKPQTTTETSAEPEVTEISQTTTETSAQPEPEVTEISQTTTETSAQPEPEVTEISQTTTQSSAQPEPEVTERPQKTEATEHPGVGTSAQPEPEVTEGPQTTDEQATTSTGPKTTTRPYPASTEHPGGVETSAQPEPEVTEKPQTTTETSAEPEVTEISQTTTETSAQTEPEVTEISQTTTETSAQPEPEVTERPQTTEATEHPGVGTSAQPEPEVTERPQTTEATEHPGVGTSAQPEPEVTEGPQTTDEQATTSTGPKTTSRPYPASTEHPGGVETSAQPEPEVTEKPQTTTETSAEPEVTEISQTTTETSAQPEPDVTEISQTTTETSAQPEPEETEISQTTTETSAQPEPEVTERPQTTEATEHPGVGTSAQPEPEVTEGPQTTDEQATTSTGSKTTSRPYPASTEHPGGVETSAQPEPEVTERPQTTAEETTTSSGPKTTARPYPPSTEHQGVETSAQPEPEVTEGPQTTLATETSTQPEPEVTGRPQTTEQTPATTGAKTTARPYPTSTEHQGVETSAQPEPEVTEGPQTTAEETATSTGPKTTGRPYPPSTEYPGVETSTQPEPEVTERPQTTLATETSTQPEPEVTERPQTTEQTPATTGAKTTARPYPPSTEHPGVETSAQPVPEVTEGPQTTAEEATTSTGPKTTARPYPPSTEHPGGVETSAQPEPEVTERPQTTAEEATTSTGPKTTARPYPPSTEYPGVETPTQPEPEVTERPQTTKGHEPTPGSQATTEIQPHSTTTASSHPSTTTEHQSTTLKPLPTTDGPQPTTTTTPQSTTTATTRPPTTPVPTPSCPENSHYTSCVPTCSPTCIQLNGPPGCHEGEGCVQGCACDEGFVRRRRACVPIKQCGCVDRNGTKYHFNDVWYTNHCREKCECERDDGVGKIDCDDKDECDRNAVCLQNEDGDYNCQSTGFKTCTINPEYRTFDKMKHDFEDEHSYVVVRTNNLPNYLPHVYIEAINTEHDNDDDDDDDDDEDHRRDSDEDDDDDDDDDDSDEKHYRLHQIKIRVYDHTVVFKKNRKLIVNGRKTDTPASPTAGLNIWERSSRIYLKTDFGLSVEFDGHSTAAITLPNVYKRKVGGLCGNFDGNRRNDWMKPDGTQARNLQEFGESWRVNG